MDLAECHMLPCESTDSDQIWKADADLHHEMDAITQMSIFSRANMVTTADFNCRKGSTGTSWNDTSYEHTSMFVLFYLAQNW